MPSPPAPRRRKIADPKPLPGDWLTSVEIVDLPIPAVQLKTFEKWRGADRHEEIPFPEEDHVFGLVPVWHLSRVEAWFKVRGMRYDLRVWRLKLELGSYLRNPAHYRPPFTPPNRAKIPAKREIPGNWLTIAEIADLPVPAVKMTTVEQWKVRHGPDSENPFPSPDDHAGGFPLYRFERVTVWLEATGKRWDEKVLESKRAADLYRHPRDRGKEETPG